MTFDKAGWDSGAGNYEGRNPRLGLVDSLDEAGIVAGAPRETVIETLGNPDVPSVPGKNEDRYYLGRNDMAPDFLTLVISYDAAGKVAKVRAAQS